MGKSIPHIQYLDDRYNTYQTFVHTMKNTINFYNHDEDNRVAVAAVKIGDGWAYAIQDFLRGDIQIRIENCSDWLHRVVKAKNDVDYFYDSFGNCCTTTITHQGVTIENEYTGYIVENISLDDMQIILEKWLDFIKTRNPVEYCW